MAQSFAARYSDLRPLKWMFVGMGGLMAVSVVGAATGAASGYFALMERVGPWLALAFVPLAFWMMRAMLPRKASVEVDDDSITIVRGRRRTVLSKGSLRVAPRRWQIQPGQDYGTILVLDDGRETITLGVRDRRIGAPTERGHTSDLYMEGEVFDALAPHLGDALERDAPSVAPEQLRIVLVRNREGFWPVFVMVAGSFGGLILGVSIGFAVEGFVSETVFSILMPAVTIACVFGPSVWFWSYPRRGRAVLTVDPAEATLTRGAHTRRAPLAALTLRQGSRRQYVRYYGEYETPRLSIAFPDAAPLVITTADARLRWPDSIPMKSARYVVGPIDFQALAAALGLELRVDRTVEDAHLRRLGGDPDRDGATSPRDTNA